MSSWTAYPSIHNLGHRAVRDLLNVPHEVSEKVDGSQISFGKFTIAEIDHDAPMWEGNSPLKTELRVRSKGAVMHPDAPEKMFTLGVEHIKSIQHKLHPGWTYRGEYLRSPAHNTLRYDRVPNGHIILFDVSTGDQEWLSPLDKQVEALRIGLECVPTFIMDTVGGATTLEMLRDLLDTRTSILGGQLIEGIVVKPLVELYGPDHKTLMGKFVSERFKEAHQQAWKVTSPKSGDILDQLSATYKVEARWMKAVQHLREAGNLQGAPQDIPALIREVQTDLCREEEETIKEHLWKWAIPHLSRSVIKGLPEWWKEQLLKMQFEVDDLGVVVPVVAGTPVAEDVSHG